MYIYTHSHIYVCTRIHRYIHKYLYRLENVTEVELHERIEEYLLDTRNGIEFN